MSDTWLGALPVAHGAAGSADELAPLVVVPVVLLALFVAHLRRRNQQQDQAEEQHEDQDPDRS